MQTTTAIDEGKFGRVAVAFRLQCIFVLLSTVCLLSAW